MRLTNNRKPGGCIPRLLAIAEEPAPPGRFRDRRRLDAKGRRHGATGAAEELHPEVGDTGPRAHSGMYLPDGYVQSSALDGKSLPTDKGWGHNKVPVSPRRDFMHSAACTQEVSGATNAEVYFGSNPIMSMARMNGSNGATLLFRAGAPVYVTRTGRLGTPRSTWRYAGEALGFPRPMPARIYQRKG
jgi:hypothetical protein